MKKKINTLVSLAACILLMASATPATAQLYSRISKKGVTKIEGDKRVSQLVEKHIELNEKIKTIPGYRIQVASLSGNDSKRRAFELKSKIRESYPNTEVYVVFDEPIFKVKVGDFRTRLEAFAFLNNMKAVYPGTIIKDNVYALPLSVDDYVPETEEDF